MSDALIKVKEFNISHNLLRVSADLLGDFKALPRVKIIFTRRDENRRLPLNYDGTAFTYTYLLDKIFTDMDKSGDMKISFEISDDEGCKAVKCELSEDFNKTLSPIIPYGRRLITRYSYLYSCSADENGISISVKKNANKISLVFNKLIKCVFGIFAFILTLFALGLSCIKNVGKIKNIGTFLRSVKTDVAVFLRKLYNDEDVTARIIAATEKQTEKYYEKCCEMPIVNNRVTFVSGRRDTLSGNEKFVYDLIKDREDLEIKVLMSSTLNRDSALDDIKEFLELYATSKVVIVDDHFTLLDSIKKRSGVKLFQLWHACGAFKTFGFSRLGKPGGPTQFAPSHRMYDYAAVSSQGIAPYYAEGFGVSDKNIIATGVPRTDIFFDKAYAEKIKTEFYNRYPTLKSKKIALFAPTFRGNGKNTAFYPTERFNPEQFVDNTKGDYAVVIKLHPFCKEKYAINEKYKGVIIDLSAEDELNDLLFVSDLLITDYSSAVFEATLLNIPMLLYAYDLEEYTAERDFYYEFKSFVPGKIVKTQAELIDAVNKGDFEKEKIPAFRDKFFTDTDGKSSQRVADKIIEAVNS